eukprot:3913492-Amphidinium_carterae.1
MASRSLQRGGREAERCAGADKGKKPRRGCLESENTAIHGQSTASTSSKTSEAEREEKGGQCEETMGETVRWIKGMMHEFRPAWLRHQTSASKDILPLPTLQVSETGVFEHLQLWRGERGREWDCTTTNLADQWLEVVVGALNSQ